MGYGLARQLVRWSSKQVVSADFDVVSADDLIGTVSIALNTLLPPAFPELSGWFPVFDSFRGICGLLHISLRLELLLDHNPVEGSAAGVALLSVSEPAHGRRLKRILGLVEELLVRAVQSTCASFFGA